MRASRSSRVSVHSGVRMNSSRPGSFCACAALLGGVLQDGIDGEHELARLLVGGFAFARVLRLDGRRSLRRARCGRADHGRLGARQRRLGDLLGL